MQPQHLPNLDQSQNFLECLDCNATTWTFQTFDDNAERKDKSLARIFNGTLDEHAAELTRLQQRGAGVFVTVNETDGKGRKRENIAKVRAFFLDLDGAPLEPVTTWEEPHIVCETSSNRWHVYWLVDDCPLDQFREVQRELIATFDGDASIHDLPRVMRLPGFWHLKGDPFMVRMIETGAFPVPFKIDEFRNKLDAIKPTPSLSEHASLHAPNANLPKGKSETDYTNLLRSMKIDGAKHASVRDVAASLVGQGCNRAFVEAFVRENCPVWDSNVEKLIDSAFVKFGKTPEPVFEADPVDLWGSFDPPELLQGLLPPIIEQFAFANGLQMGADPAGLAVAALVTCAAAIPDKVKIKVKRHDDWTESARIWAALVGPPSAKKSPILSAATNPICRLDVGMMRAWQKRVTKYDALPPEERKGKERPKQTRLRIEDATIESAQQVLEGSPWGVLMLQDELSGFFGAMDKYNGGKGASADRAFWLRSFNGGEFALNRVGRGAAIIDNLSVSMLGGIQPEPLRKIAGDSVDDGLLQRLFPIVLRTAKVGRDEPMPPVNKQYSALIDQLHKMKPPGWMAMDTLEFDDGAQRIRRDLEARHLDLQSLETINRKLASHIGKYDGLFARLCVVWHCVEHVEQTMLCAEPDFEGSDLPTTVTEATAQRVAEFLHRFLMAHAIAFYSGVLGLSDDHDRLTAIAGHILTHKLERITNRDVQRGDRTMRGLKEFEIRPLLEQLAALGWLDRIDPPRPSAQPHWKVNPAVHDKFKDRAFRESKRRTEAREAIQSLARGKP